MAMINMASVTNRSFQRCSRHAWLERDYGCCDDRVAIKVGHEINRSLTIRYTASVTSISHYKCNLFVKP